MDFNWYVDKRLVHEFHTSERKSFRGCRRRWDWIFRDNYYPKMTPKPLDFGTAFHKALEVYYDPINYEMFTPEVRLEAAIAAFVEKTKKQRLKALDAGVQLDDDVEKDFDERVQLGIGMLRHFVNNVAPLYDNKWKPLKVEVEFMVPIPHPHTKEPMWCKCDTCWAKWLKAGVEVTTLPTSITTPDAAQHWDEDIYKYWAGLPVVYAGRIDCLGEDEHGDLWIIDWKTAARIPDNHAWLELDDQVASYAWALWSIGMNVRGFIYHEQKKGYPLPPPRNKYARLGRMYSVKKDLDTDYEMYLKTVKENDTAAYEAGLYDFYLNFLKEEGQIFFYRQQLHKTTDELVEVQTNLGLEVLDMLSPTLAIYPNPGRFACEYCAFQTPCIEKNTGGDYTYALDTMFEKRQAYYLREELSTDKKSQL